LFGLDESLFVAARFAAMTSPGAPDLRQVHALTALVPVLGFLIAHLVQARGAAAGRVAYVEGMWGLDGNLLWTIVEALFFVLPLGVHVALGIRLGRARRDGPASPEDADGNDAAFPSALAHRWQRVTGLLAFLFVVVHLAHTWVMRLAGRPGGRIFDDLGVALGQPVWLLVYAAGLGAVAVHLGAGLPAALVRVGWAPGRGPTARALRVLGFGLGLLVWLWGLDATAAFATGAGWLP
jgi:succinate dehydrogenase/fumarate reductase cytochrome b subunit